MKVCAEIPRFFANVRVPAEPYHKVRRRRLIAATAWALCGTLAGWRRYTGLAVCEAIRADAACRRRCKPRRGSRRWPTARSRR